MMRLVVEKGKLAGNGFELERPSIVIGRGQDCDIILDEHQISRRHAQLQQTPQGWMLVDLGSTNGTQVNGLPLRAQQPHAIQPGDRISVGACELVLRSAAARAPELPAGPRGRASRPALLIVGAVLITVVLVGVVVAIVVTLRDKEGETTPGGLNPLDQVDEVIEIPTLIEGITTALPVPTGLEDLATAIPVPTGLEDMATSLPVPTQIQELVTALPDIPELPMLPPATPPPLVGASLSGYQGAEQ